MFRQFLFAVQFLTRLPVPLRGPLPTESEQGKSLLYYPLIGLLIGLLLVVTDGLLASVDPLLRAALLLVVWVAVTGGLHIDGLADMSDAWIGGQGSRARTLEIMKDPTCGPMAVIAILLLLLVKLVALQLLSTKGAWGVLLLVPLLGRGSLVAIFLYLPYVRPAGLGAVLAANLPRRQAERVLLASGLVCLILLGWPGVWILLSCATLFYLCYRALSSRLGGFTGDAAGAVCELTEVVCLVVAAMQL
jgi:adenosylcobinamide-GDP ribazoletransferase